MAKKGKNFPSCPVCGNENVWEALEEGMLWCPKCKKRFPSPEKTAKLVTSVSVRRKLGSKH